MNLKQAFGKNVQKYRKLRGYTQEKLAEMVGIDATSISSIETGKFFPTADNIQKISNSLELKIETLFNFNNNKSEEEVYREILGILKDLKNDSTQLNSVKNFLDAII